MKRIIQPIYDALNGKHGQNRNYPTLSKGDGKVHVLYVHCLLNGSGLYRMILPHQELNKTSTHAAVIGTMHKWDFNKSFNDYDNPLDRRLVEWADIIVFPEIFTDVTYIQEALLKINNELGFVMDLDRAIHARADLRQKGANVSEKEWNTLLGNLARMDVVTVPNASLMNFYTNALRERFKYPAVAFSIVPNLIPSEEFLQFPQRSNSSSKRLRIGLIGSPSIGQEAFSIRDAILQCEEEHPGKIEMVLFGWNGLLNGKPLFNGVSTIYQRPVNVMKYYDQLDALELDLAVLPRVLGSSLSFGKSTIRFAELAALSIPVIAHEKSPYASLIAHGENGILASNQDAWKEAICHLIDDDSAYLAIGQYAQKFAFKNLSWNRFKTKILADTFS